MTTETIAMSSCAFPGRPVAALDRLSRTHGLTIEYSSGFRYEHALAKKFLAARGPKLIHNYFPPPRRPFVFNLASLDSKNWNASMKHAKQGLRLAQKAGAPFYSCHAGFCFDPKPRELGHPLDHYALRHPRSRYWKRFIKAIRILTGEAQRLGVDLLIENNVVSLQNRAVPLLCADPTETRRLFQEVRHPRLGLLVDTGHLKVSARTLRFSTDRFLKAVHPYIRAFHHNENDGRTDTNRPLAASYWFLPWLSRFPGSVHVIEVCKLTPQRAKQQVELLRRAISTTPRQRR